MLACTATWYHSPTVIQIIPTNLDQLLLTINGNIILSRFILLQNHLQPTTIIPSPILLLLLPNPRLQFIIPIPGIRPTIGKISQITHHLQGRKLIIPRPICIPFTIIVIGRIDGLVLVLFLFGLIAVGEDCFVDLELEGLGR